MEPQEMISYYFSEQPRLTPYRSEDGPIGPVHVIVYYTSPSTKEVNVLPPTPNQ